LLRLVEDANRKARIMNVKSSDAVAAAEVKGGKKAVRQVLIGPEEAPHFAMRRFIMQPGGGMPNHTNTVEHEQYVLRGTAAIGVGSEVREVKKGDVLFIPAGVPHWYEAKGSEPFEFLCVVPNLPDKIELVNG
jgi:quercetin dioxygenase-like cupin family protein